MAVLDIEGDAARVIETIAGGGIAVIPLDVAYAIFGHSAESVLKIFAAKGRSFEKPSGMLANFEIFEALHMVGAREKDMVRAVTDDYGLPMSVVAPFRADHPFLAGVEPLAIERSTMAGTLDLLLNAGPLANEIARISFERSLPLLGSSANRSLSGSKFRFGDVEREVRDVASLSLDYGLCRYHNPEGISSTIIDLSNFTVVRYGCCFAQIADILQRHFGVELSPKVA